MAITPLFSLDRIERDFAVMIDDDGVSEVVAIVDLPPEACAGKMYRKIDGRYVEDGDAERVRRARIQVLQNRLRRRK